MQLTGEEKRRIGNLSSFQLSAYLHDFSLKEVETLPKEWPADQTELIKLLLCLENFWAREAIRQVAKSIWKEKKEYT